MIFFVILFFAFIFIVFSGFLSGAETAFFALSASDKEILDKEETSSSKTINQLLERPDYLLATILIFNVLLVLLVVVLGVYSCQKLLTFDANPSLIFWVEVACWVALVVVFGEIIPRLYAKKNPLKLLYLTASTIKTLELLCRPLSKLVINTTNLIDKSLEKKSVDLSVEELSKVLQSSSEEISEEKEILEGIISLHNKTAVEIMTPRLDIADIDIKSNFKQVIDYAINIGYSRIPVYSKTQDDIKGILYLKDLLPYIDKPETFRWQSLIRSAFFVPETKKIDDLLEEFQTNKIHLAVVVDEFGGTSGIVTVEDILEEIVGEIDDEYDDEVNPKFEKLQDGAFLFEAKISLADFFKITEIDPKEFEKQTVDVDTLAGLVLELKGDFPKTDEIISYNSYRFEVSDINERRIQKVKFYRETEDE
ncbi:MAG: gliding motility-associated protein GldE [Dysgonamonadaceae bacterium]|jgi:gliding motility-associated protein GldE|nr:gliding motility-associated protein GldE [Dysgonamonadaceae bacterium]